MNLNVSGTRRFETPLQVEREPRFEARAPIDVDSYDGLIGFYGFADDWMKCCVLKPSGKLCEREHQRGWVARRKDGVVTLIGGDCAKDKFAAGSIALEDIKRAENEIERLANEERLRELLADRDAKVEEIDTVFRDLKTLRDRIERVAEEIGPQPWARVRIQAMSGSTQVTVRGYTPAVRDKAGDVISPRRDVRIAVGALPGVRACAPDRIKLELIALSSLRRRYAEELPTEGRKRSAAVKALAAALADQPRQISQARRLLADGEAFIASDLAPLVFLSNDPGVRVKLAQLVHRRAGQTIGRSAAKEWLQRRDRELAESHAVVKVDL